MPASYGSEARQLGLSDSEQRRPFAHYFNPSVRPVQQAVRRALDAGAAHRDHGYEIDDVARRLSAPGYEAMENGWAWSRQGTLLVACYTDMPRVSAAMWDWWFGWHSTDSARYKLWHPGAHLFCALGEDRSSDRTLTDRQRYIDNVSYVDEYVGKRLHRLGIRFFDPARLGFSEQPGVTHICARVGASDVPVVSGWVVHQVRPTQDGCEMRSRFFLGKPQVLDLPPHASSNPTSARMLTSKIGGAALSPLVSMSVRLAIRDQMGRDLLEHCGSEMNHLAAFLPELYAEFKDAP
ncbi:MAG: hypothetical protein OXR73_10950 [Myxococcales bacterium]|nr:hypothetical protein [Myxococcales bacterium]